VPPFCPCGGLVGGVFPAPGCPPGPPPLEPPPPDPPGFPPTAGFGYV
jgi:hypothetical protein